MSDILAGDATDLSRRITAGEVSAVEVMQATLDRIAERNPAVNAIISLRNPAELLAEARAADTGARKGWLHGIPLAIKDLADVAGIRTTKGSPFLADQVPDADCGMVRRLKAAGGLVIGKTNTPEFGLGSHTYNPVHGATLNPYDAGLTCGGSSGGAAVALATRMLSVADGSDMMGSLRNPGAFNNVYGFRPSWGRVPADPVGDTYLKRISTDGPMARSVRDLAAFLEVQMATDPRLPAPHWPPIRLSGNLQADISGRRIAWLSDWGGAYAMEPGIIELAEAALDVLSDLGATIETVAPPHSSDAIFESWTALRAFSVAANLGPYYAEAEKRGQLKPAAIYEIEHGLGLSAMDLQRASELRSGWLVAAVNLFNRFDAMVLPSAQVFPFEVTLDWPKEIAGRAMDTYHRWMEVTVPASLLGLPALNVPVGFDGAGRPMGMQIIGAPGADLEVLQLGEAYHQATDWPGKYPPRL